MNSTVRRNWLALLIILGSFIGLSGADAASVAGIDVVVSLRVSTPTVAVDPTSVSLQQEVGGAAVSLPFSIWNANADGTRMNYLVAASPAWLSCTPTSGVSTGDVQGHTLRVDPAGLGAGDHSGEIIVTAPGADNSPLVVPVNLRLDAASLPNLKIENFDFAPEDVSPDGGTTITFAGRILNDGTTATTGSFSVEFCVWHELPGQPGEILLTDVWPATVLLAPGESIDLASVILQTKPLAEGAYYVGILADFDDVVREQNENDNGMWVTHKKLYVGPRRAAVRIWRMYR